MQISKLMAHANCEAERQALQSFADLGYNNMLDVNAAAKNDTSWVGQYHHHWNAGVVMNTGIQSFRQKHFDRFGQDVIQIPEIRRLSLPITVTYLPPLQVKDPDA